MLVNVVALVPGGLVYRVGQLTRVVEAHNRSRNTHYKLGPAGLTETKRQLVNQSWRKAKLEA